jgi:radical SAM superfamily enzyme YgiQ (UPF0313 family)
MEKLNFLLVMPRLDSFNVFPLGIPYISSVMKQAGFNVFTLNLNHIDGDTGDIVNNEIEKNGIDVLMTGGLSAHFNKLNMFIESARLKKPSLKIIVGGGIITADPEVAMKAFENADIGVIGEGEQTVVELCGALQDYGIDLDANILSNIKGIIYYDKINRIWTQTKAREEIKDLDSLPFPDYDGFGIRRYLEMKPQSIAGFGKEREVNIIASRSCPYQCTFCFHTTGKKYRRRSIDKVLEEVRYLKNKYDIKSIVLHDELFSMDNVYVKKFCEALKEMDIVWNAQFRVDDVSFENIETVKNGNCYGARMGIESADNEILKSMRKNISVEQTERAVSIIHNAGLPIFGNLIIGDVAETFETAKKSIEWWKRYKEHCFGLYFIDTYPGTPNYKYAVKNGIIKNRVEFLKNGCPTVNLSKMSDEELSIIIKEVVTLPIKELDKLKEQKILKYNKNDTADFSGFCHKCGKYGIYKEKLLFFVNNLNFLYCENCGHRFIPEISEEIKYKTMENLKKLPAKKIAIWGVLPYTIEIFDGNKEFCGKDIVFIDNSSYKQMIIINGKKVRSPEILANEDIDTLICCYKTARLLSEKLYPEIKNHMNFGELLYGGEK